MTDLKEEFRHYLDNKASFLAEYMGKFIVLKDQKVLGVFDDQLTAIRETAKTLPVGSFLVQHVTDDDEQVRFHSRHAL